MDKAKINWPLMIGSLFLSALLWTIVYPQTVVEDTLSLSAKVEVEGLPSNLTVTSMPPTIMVRAMGSKAKLQQIDAGQLKAVVSLSKATAGRKSYKAVIYPVHYQEFFAGQVVTVPLTIEAIASRTLTVEVETMGQMSDPAIALDETAIEPSQVTITGPKTIVEQVAKARAMLDITGLGLNNKGPQTLGVELLMPNGSVARDAKLEVQPMLVTVMPIINSAPQQKTVLINANVQGSPAEGYITAGYQVTPPQVMLRGSSRAIAAVTQIMTEPINLVGLKQTTDFIVNLRVPEGLVADKRRITVRVLVKPLTPTQPPETPPSTTGQ
jgi:YbbR domain-containing protein